MAIWGTAHGDMRNITVVEAAGFPVTIECDWIEPDDYELREFGRRYWVREADHLRVVKKTT